jgi:tetratricopeptide (TPR) repeat protein
VEEIKGQLAYDTLVGLSSKMDGEFTEATLANRILPFIRFNTNIDIKLDRTAQGQEKTFSLPAFQATSALQLLHQVMQHFELALRAENANPEIAEKAYFRMSSVYRKDNRMFEALENINTLLARYPETPRLAQALKLKLDVYKGLKNYGKALETLDRLRATPGDAIEAYKLDYEAGRIYFDMCDYAQAETFYSRALTDSAGRSEWLKIREALALAYARQGGKERDALTQYRDLLRYESSPLRQSINRLMLLYLNFMISKDRQRSPLPEEEANFIAAYESMSDPQRATIGANKAARATWIYYVSALLDMQENKPDEALRKLDVAGRSPDSLLAGDALVRAGKIHMARGEYEEARQLFEHLLFAIKEVEPKVQATFHLARCLEQLGDSEQALRRFTEITERYPVSPYAARSRQASTNLTLITASEAHSPAATGETDRP